MEMKKKSPILSELIDYGEITWYKENLMIFNNESRKFYTRNEVIESIQKRYKVTMYFVEVSNLSRGVIYGQVIYNHSQDIRFENLSIRFKTPIRFEIVLVDNVEQEEFHGFEDPKILEMPGYLRDHHGVTNKDQIKDNLDSQNESDFPQQAMRRNTTVS